MHIQPASLSFDAHGTPFSAGYGDVYHSADSGPGQARHVFLGGNDLPVRWANARVFTILETGFGFGLNFLATWRAWLDDPARPERLHFVSIEKHPFERNALAALHARYEEYAPLAARLREAWPVLVPNLHRLHFEDERVTLTLAFGDVAAVLPKLRLAADAIYLDGFAPARNPEMWSPHVMKRLAQLARADATLSTWSAAGVVREGLEAAGFEVAKRPGFGHKREMLCARYAPRWNAQRAPASPVASPERHAIVVGAGLAGAAAAERLARRGWRIDLVDRETVPSRPRNRLAGIFRPHISADDAILSRLARNGYLYGVSRWQALERAGHALEWDRCGVLQLAERTRPADRMAQTAAALGFPEEYVQYVDCLMAESLAGIALESGGWWFPGGGWMRPSSLLDAQGAAAGIERRVGRVESIDRSDGLWRAVGAGGRALASAPVLILANAEDAIRLAPVGENVARVRGQVTYVPSSDLAAPRTVLTGRGYVLPAIDGVVMIGSTYDRNGDDPRPNPGDHEANLARAARILPGTFDGIDPQSLQGAVGFRSVAPDRLPLAGAMPDVDATRAAQADLRGAHERDIPRHAGLYCVSGFASRGLTWAAAAGELVASLLEGEPLPLESDLADAIDPARFVLRQLRAGTL